MTALFFVLGICQALLIWYLGQMGLRLVQRGQREHEQAQFEPAGGWPKCALIVPVAGSHPNMEDALLSLCNQEYPDYSLIFVVARGDAAAGALVGRLAAIYPAARVVLAEEAPHCGQKNWNLLTGVKAVPAETQIYAFCDSTHHAQPDFLRCLILPIARKECAFSTGYHQVQPKDRGIVTLGYALTVLFMRFMQGIAGLTQLWGGAMAMTAAAFYHYDVPRLWASNVVDDCSLSAVLMEHGVKVQLAPAALLVTSAGNHVWSVWSAWLKRQILFLKFCIPGQWIGLGIFCLFMAIPPIWALWAFWEGLADEGSAVAPFLALCWLCFVAWALNGWRRYFAFFIPVSHWIWAFFTTIFLFFTVYGETIFTRIMLWHNITYEVGKRGAVIRITRNK